MNKEKISGWIIFVLVIFNILSVFLFFIYLTTYEERNDRCKEMCPYLNLSQYQELDGIYKFDKYFCVWTKGKTDKAINNTYCHESCHDFIHKDPEHFCRFYQNLSGINK